MTEPRAVRFDTAGAAGLYAVVNPIFLSLWETLVDRSYATLPHLKVCIYGLHAGYDRFRIGV